MTTLTAEKVIDRIEEMCQVLRTNYQSYSIAQHRAHVDRGDNVEYHQEQINKLCEGENVDDYIYERGKKYARIVHISNPGGQRSAHAFVDLNNGNVYKSKDWRGPSLNGVRYNLLDDVSREQMYKRADFAGSYLYK